MKEKNSIECYVIRQNEAGQTEILLLHKPETNRHPAFWQPITGGIEAGESPLEACIREIKEEANFLVSGEDILDLNYKFEIYIEEYDMIIKKTLFLCRNKGTGLKISEEHDDFRWEKIDAVPGFLFWDSNKNTFSKLYSVLN
jgi:8-oxo-dGTP pyrophosphatase MutT (NUDIX family)